MKYRNLKQSLDNLIVSLSKYQKTQTKKLLKDIKAFGEISINSILNIGFENLDFFFDIDFVKEKLDEENKLNETIENMFHTLIDILEFKNLTINGINNLSIIEIINVLRDLSIKMNERILLRELIRQRDPSLLIPN